MVAFPQHEVTVKYRVPVPHEVDLSDVKQAFEDEVLDDTTLYVEDEDGEQQDIDVKVEMGSVSWREIED